MELQYNSTFLSNSFKRSEHFFRRRISPSFKNDIILLEAGAFKFLRNRLLMMSMQIPRKRDVPSRASRKFRARYRDNNMQYSAKLFSALATVSYSVNLVQRFQRRRLKFIKICLICIICINRLKEKISQKNPE